MIIGGSIDNAEFSISKNASFGFVYAAQIIAVIAEKYKKKSDRSRKNFCLEFELPDRVACFYLELELTDSILHIACQQRDVASSGRAQIPRRFKRYHRASALRIFV